MSQAKSARRSRNLIAIAGAAAVAGFGSSRADAGLFMDLRVLPSDPNYLTDHSFALSSPGDTVTLGLFAQVTGTNGVNDELFQSVYGLVNSSGGIKGNLSGGYLPAFFTPGSSQNGSVLDWDSDGDLDIGLSPTNSGQTGKFAGRSPSPVPMPSLGGAVQVGQFLWTATDVAGGFVNISFTLRNSNGANLSQAALWFEDSSSISKSPTLSSASVGPGVVNGPEPSAVSAAALVSIGLLKRRRDRHIS